jgi:1-acyl-sn-glycerol-3-phosphate acyltransferase
MSKWESSEMGRPRRPAARRAPAHSESKPEGEVEADVADPGGQPGKRIHARRSKADSDPPPGEPRPQRPAAVRARASAGAQADESAAKTEPSQPDAAPARPRGARARPPSDQSGRDDARVAVEQPAALDPAVDAGAPRDSEPPRQAAGHAAPEALRSEAQLDPDELAGWSSPSRPRGEAADARPELDSLALRRRGGEALRVRTDAIDDFGLDGVYEAKLRPFFEAVCRNYLHVVVQGAHNIPAHGRALLVSNHSRALSWDGIVLRTALRQHHDAHRELRWLVEDEQFHAPFLGTFINRLGAVRACQENAERLLAREELVAVFPEGVKVNDKRYQDRYKLMRFGRGGYVKLALRTGAPVIPVAIMGSEEPSPLLHRNKTLSRWLGRPLFALSPALPRLGALGVPPLPSQWRISIGEPVREIARQDADAIRDDGLIHELNECVRASVQALLDQSLRSES